jgi:hypothetical protein
MVGNEVHDEEAQSLKDLVEEATKAPPQKPKKKKIGKDEANLNKAHERILSFVTRRRGGRRGENGLSAKSRRVPKKNKGKEKVLEPLMESPKLIDFHSFSKSNVDVHSLILILNGPMKGKGGKQALEHPIVDEFLEK